MKEKLEYLLKNKQLSATELARMLEIQPSGISHLLSGRNKPSFDLLVKILRVFPDINPDWLLLDSDQVYRTDEPMSSPSSTPALFDDRDYFDAESADEKNNEPSETNSEIKNVSASIFSHSKSGSKFVERVIVLYSDKSFESYSL